MGPKANLLIKDNLSDIALTRCALEKARIANQLVIAEDGQEALDYLFGPGVHAARDLTDHPALMLLNQILPKIPDLEVLRGIRSHPSTRWMPLEVLTSSNEEQPVDLSPFARAVEQAGWFWLLLNEPQVEAGAER